MYPQRVQSCSPVGYKQVPFTSEEGTHQFYNSSGLEVPSLLTCIKVQRETLWVWDQLHFNHSDIKKKLFCNYKVTGLNPETSTFLQKWIYICFYIISLEKRVRLTSFFTGIVSHPDPGHQSSFHPNFAQIETELVERKTYINVCSTSTAVVWILAGQQLLICWICQKQRVSEGKKHLLFRGLKI